MRKIALGTLAALTTISDRNNQGSAFVVCAPNGNATIMVTGTGDDFNLSQQLADKYRRSLGL